jgi:transcriptional regulator with XRE-family HTH domain
MASDAELPEGVLPAAEVARRVRAARAYAGLSVSDVATAIGLGAQTIKRIEAGRRTPRSFEIWAIADVCGLPREWFMADFKALSHQAERQAELLRRVEEQLAAVAAMLNDERATAVRRPA